MARAEPPVANSNQSIGTGRHWEAEKGAFVDQRGVPR